MIFLLINYFIDNQIEFIKITKFDFSYLFLIFISYSLSMFFSSSKDLFIFVDNSLAVSMVSGR